LGGHLMALRQEDIKRLLAYSTVAQIGYVLIGVGTGTAAGISAAFFHAINHMFMKVGLFIAAGHIAEDMKTRNISDLRGLYHHRRWFVIVFSLLAAAIVGIPPLGGFMSKWYLMLATTKAGNVIPALVLAFGTVISAFYYMRILKVFYSSGDPPPRQTDPYWSLAIAGTCALCCVFLGFVSFVPSFWKLFSDMGINAVDTAEYISTILSK